jgi:peptidoglycan/LPS O-acetylase OafA/YrhL
MKKIITAVSIALLPIVTFAQNYGYHMVNGYNGGYGWQATGPSTVGIFWLFMIPLVWFIIVLALFIFWLIMLIDAIKYAPEKMKIVWVLVIILTCIVGAFIYYFVEKKPREKAKSIEKKEEKKEAHHQ